MSDHRAQPCDDERAYFDPVARMREKQAMREEELRQVVAGDVTWAELGRRNAIGAQLKLSGRSVLVYCDE